MTGKENTVIDFLRFLGGRPADLDDLRTRSKDEVIAAAAGFGYPFTDSDYNDAIWNLEIRLAGERGENFDSTFSLWQTLWGRYYLEYLVHDLVPALETRSLI